MNDIIALLKLYLEKLDKLSQEEKDIILKTIKLFYLMREK